MTYKSYHEDEDAMSRLTWFGLLKQKDIDLWLLRERTSYFNYMPNKRDWLVLIMMSTLNFINLLFSDPEKNGMEINPDIQVQE
jgi:hypothetical protein